MKLTPDMLAILVCPQTRTPLRLDGDWLVSDRAGLTYPVTDGVPRLYAEAARRVDEIPDLMPPPVSS